MRLLEVFPGVFRKDGRRKGAKSLTVLDAAVKNFLHFRTARVCDDAAIAKRARTPFRATLEPAENFSIGDDRGGAA